MSGTYITFQRVGRLDCYERWTSLLEETGSNLMRSLVAE
jgi:hypothetical protein